MSEHITFTVPGKPSGKARPRSTAHGKFYSPKSGAFQAKVAEAAKAAGVAMLDGCVMLEVFVERRMPSSWSRKKRERLAWTHAPGARGHSPDGCNVEAEVWDALQGIAYDDDSAVAASAFTRVWAEHDRTTITVGELPATEQFLSHIYTTAARR